MTSPAPTVPDRRGVSVVGSANLDLIFTADRIPLPGETVLARGSARFPGGKGLNQVIAAARAGAQATFIAALGTDEFGELLLGTITEAGIDDRLVRRVAEPTGQAFIVVSLAGENSIVVASGANATMHALREAEADAVRQSSVLLMQFELPLDVVTEAAMTARASGTVVMVNAAPAHMLPEALIESLDYLIVNEHEACELGGSTDLAVASRTLAALLPRLVVTVGAEGSVLYDAGSEVARVPALRVIPVDTTGAGDTFCGAFAAAIAEGRDFVAAARFATAAAALSVQAEGAVPSIPRRPEIDDLLAGVAR